MDPPNPMDPPESEDLLDEGSLSERVTIQIEGVSWQVPSKTSLLRCFQSLESYAISMGGFCWNADCHTCEVLAQKEGEEPEKMLSCQTTVAPNMIILEMTDKLRFCLRGLRRS